MLCVYMWAMLQENITLRNITVYEQTQLNRVCYFHLFYVSLSLRRSYLSFIVPTIIHELFHEIIPAAEETFITNPPLPPLSFLMCSTASIVPLIIPVWKDRQTHEVNL